MTSPTHKTDVITLGKTRNGVRRLENDEKSNKCSSSPHRFKACYLIWRLFNCLTLSWHQLKKSRYSISNLIYVVVSVVVWWDHQVGGHQLHLYLEEADLIFEQDWVRSVYVNYFVSILTIITNLTAT